MYRNNSTSLKKIFQKSQLINLCVMFLICSLTFVSISIITMQTYVTQNLNLLGSTLSERVQPALVFRDDVILKQILNEYTQEHSIRTIYVYDNSNNLIANSTENPNHFSSLQKLFDHWFLNQPATFTIYHQQKIGKLQIYGSSEKILQFLLTILIGVFISLFAMLITLWISTKFTYRFIIQAIYPLSQIARLVSEQKAYNLRFPNNKIKEFQHINNVFNELLSEIQVWHNHLQKENSQLSFQAKHDALTKLPNRGYFYQNLLAIFENPEDRDHSALLFIDNNNFKMINDKYGHLAGDAVLVEMAKRIKLCLRSEDFIARLGGDEFAIIIKSIHRTQHLTNIAEKIVATTQEPLPFNDEMIYFSFSMGMAFSSRASSPEDLITQADQAMYKAKNSTKNWSISHKL